MIVARPVRFRSFREVEEEQMEVQQHPEQRLLPRNDEWQYSPGNYVLFLEIWRKETNDLIVAHAIAGTQLAEYFSPHGQAMVRLPSGVPVKMVSIEDGSSWLRPSNVELQTESFVVRGTLINLTERKYLDLFVVENHYDLIGLRDDWTPQTLDRDYVETEYPNNRYHPLFVGHRHLECDLKLQFDLETRPPLDSSVSVSSCAGLKFLLSGFQLQEFLYEDNGGWIFRDGIATEFFAAWDGVSVGYVLEGLKGWVTV